MCVVCVYIYVCVNVLVCVRARARVFRIPYIIKDVAPTCCFNKLFVRLRQLTEMKIHISGDRHFKENLNQTGNLIKDYFIYKLNIYENQCTVFLLILFYADVSVSDNPER